MLEINDHLRIPAAEFEWSFARSGGPGGQNVNKVASKAVLRWNLAASPSLPEEVKVRLRTRNPSRVTIGGEFMMTSERYRDQERNRQDCLDKLRELIRQAAVTPRRRRPTKPSRGSREARLQDKRRRAGTKAQRKRPTDE